MTKKIKCMRCNKPHKKSKHLICNFCKERFCIKCAKQEFNHSHTCFECKTQHRINKLTHGTNNLLTSIHKLKIELQIARKYQ